MKVDRYDSTLEGVASKFAIRTYICMWMVHEADASQETCSLNLKRCPRI